MLATIVNAATILLGSLIGLKLKSNIKENYKNLIMDGLGLTVIVIGLSSSIKTKMPTLIIVSLFIGAIIGENLKLDEKLKNLSLFVEKKFDSDNNFAQAFMVSSLVYVVGAMAIVGSIEAGLSNNYTTLYAKSVLDGISSIIFASTLGIGVMFSIIPVIIYQGSITLLASFFAKYFTTSLINEVSAVGGVLIIAIALNLLVVKRVKVANLLLSLFIPIIYFLVFR